MANGHILHMVSIVVTIGIVVDISEVENLKNQTGEERF